MKIKKEINLESKAKKEIRPDTIDLNQISKIINDLNMIVAPTISVNLFKADELINQKTRELNDRVISLKKLNKETLELKKEKDMLSKRLKVIALLSDLHGNFKVNSNIRVETLNIIRDIDTFTDKRLTMQIEKLEKVLSN